MDDTKNSTRETEGKKTTQDHWQRIWRRQTPYTYGFLRRTIKSPTDRRLGLVFKQHLPQERKRILEIGCASGRWLVRFKREFDYNVYGIDYSEAGCELAKETLRRTKIEGEIICGDIFDPSLQDKYKEFFDIVYSLGFIEHFSDPTDALDMHLRLLKPDGFLIVTVPNYGDGSINRKWIRITGREEHLVKTHNVELMKIATFKKHLETFESVKIHTLDYIGPIRLPIGSRYISLLCNLVLGYLTFFMNSETFSPDIVLIARKRCSRPNILFPTGEEETGEKW